MNALNLLTLNLIFMKKFLVTAIYIDGCNRFEVVIGHYTGSHRLPVINEAMRDVNKNSYSNKFSSIKDKLHTFSCYEIK